MITNEEKNKFLEELEEIPIASWVCKKLNFSKASLYRLIKKDKKFREKFNEAIKKGKGSINDLAESKVIARIKKDDWAATKYWLDNNKKDYMRPRPKNFWEQMVPPDNLAKITFEIVNKRRSKEEIEKEIRDTTGSGTEKDK